MAKIVVALPDLDNEFQRLQLTDAKAAAARHGLNLDVLNAERNSVLQVQQLFKHIHLPETERPRALIVEPLAETGLERISQAAAAAGIGWVTMNWDSSAMAELRKRFPRLPIFAVGSSQVEIGRIQGRQFRIALPGGGQVLHIRGPQSSQAADERQRGMVESTEGAGIETTWLEAQWTEETAEQAVKGWLRLKSSESATVDLVAGQDDSMARGARLALETSHAWHGRWKHVPFFGIDGVPEVGQRLVDSGVLTATIAMPSNAGPAIDAVAHFLTSGVVPPPSLVLTARSYPDEVELARRLAVRRTS